MIDPRAPDFASTPVAADRPAYAYAPAPVAPGDPAAPPVVAVITPFYNPGEVFRETARCVMEQSLQAFEWIIVNDGSTDPASLAILDEWRARDPRVRVIDQPNAGPGAARNAAIRAARAPYIFQLDADDLIEPTTLEKGAWFLASHANASFVKGYTVGFSHNPHLWGRGFHDGDLFLTENLATISAMLRTSVLREVGGYDESIRGGMEDWDLWIRLAAAGRWGGTIPEHLDWYRRRPNHADVWHDWDAGNRQSDFQTRLRARHPALFAGGFPRFAPEPPKPFEPVAHTLPFANPLAKSRPRLLMAIPWLRMGGADKFNLDLIAQLVARGWEVTVVTTLSTVATWLPEATRLTPDVFVAPAFVRFADRPLLLRYLIESRRPDVVLVSNSELGYQVLPYLRAACPAPAYVDYNHMEEEGWKNGGYPRYGAAAADLLDLSIVTSAHLKAWMVARGGDPARTEVCYINVDPARFEPSPAVRAAVRSRLDIAADLPVLLYPVRLCPQKQPRVFARTIHALRDRGIPCLALVAGDGEDRPWLQRYIERHHLGDQIWLLGEKRADEVRDLLLAADLFFLPSQWEGIALAVYEAMAAGVPVVGANVGGQAELVAEGCGVLIDRADEDAEVARYTDALAALLADPASRAAMSAVARRRIEEGFTLDAMGERMDALLHRAIWLRRDDPRPAIAPGLAREAATRGLEYIRMQEVAETLWAELEHLRGEAARTPHHPAHHPGHHAEPKLAGDPGYQVFRELEHIEHSRAWRTVGALKRTALYRALASATYGAGWDRRDPGEDPARRLVRIKTSRAYRLIQAVKSTPLYRTYAAKKYGADPVVTTNGRH